MAPVFSKAGVPTELEDFPAIPAVVSRLRCLHLAERDLGSETFTSKYQNKSFHLGLQHTKRVVQR